MLRCTASFPVFRRDWLIEAYFYVHLIPHDFFASCKDAQSQPFGPGPGLCALPANFLRNHHNFDFLQVPHKYLTWIGPVNGLRNRVQEAVITCFHETGEQEMLKEKAGLFRARQTGPPVAETVSVSGLPVCDPLTPGGIF